MHCNTCDTVNDDTARFCRNCGTPFASAPPRYVVSSTPMTGDPCPLCQRRNPAGARFCVYCATSLTEAIQPTYGNAPVHGISGGGAATAVAYAPAQQIVINLASNGNLLLRAVWFFLVGWWLGLVWTIIAWLFNLTLIGLPVGLLMLNAIPQVMTLRPRYAPLVRVAPNGTAVVMGKVQQPLALRALWFIFIGWWASLLWMLVAWSLCSTILLMPIAFWMFDRVPTITTMAAE
jgi:uncharacterized membrane protein YccF (DUF307 family)